MNAADYAESVRRQFVKRHTRPLIKNVHARELLGTVISAIIGTAIIAVMVIATNHLRDHRNSPRHNEEVVARG